MYTHRGAGVVSINSVHVVEPYLASIDLGVSGWVRSAVARGRGVLGDVEFAAAMTGWGRPLGSGRSLDSIPMAQRCCQSSGSHCQDG